MDRIIKFAFEASIKAIEENREMPIDLTPLHLTNREVVDTLKELGYEEGEWDTNGWEQDTWIPFYKTGHPNLVFSYGGYYGGQQLYREDIDEESTYVVTVEVPCTVMGRVNYGVEKGELELTEEEYEEFKKNPRKYIKEHYEEIDTDFKVEDYDIDYREPISFNDVSYKIKER